MRDKYDIVIIGSGIGALVSAALLSDLGKKILIIEKEPKPGGYLTEFKNEDFIFDVSLHLLNGCSEGQYIYDIFKRCHIIDGINFLKPKYLYRSVFPDFDLRVPQTNIYNYKEALKDLFPKSKKGIDDLFEEMSEVFHLINNRFSYKHISSPLFYCINHTYENIIDKRIKDFKLKAIICQLWIYFGLPPSMIRAIDFCYPWFDYVNNGGYYIEKGSYEIVRALVAYIRSKEVDFLFNKNVGRILVENGSSQRVAFGKDEILCDTVISNIDLTKTVFELIGSKKFLPTTIEKLRSIEPSISAFEIFLGLDVDLKNIYPDDYEIFVNSNYDIEKQYQDCRNNSAKTAPFVITINSNVNRFSAPKGKSAITVIMLAGYNYWISKSKGEYEDKKEKIADILIDRASKVIPEIKTHMQKKVVSTPVTFERYTNNSRGAIYGYSRTVGQKTEVRPNEIKNVKNLYFASAWAKQGSGVVKVLHSAEDVYRKISKLVYNNIAV